MKYTRWNEDLHCHEVPLLFKEDGQPMEFTIYTNPDEITIDGKGNRICTGPGLMRLCGDVIERLAELEHKATPRMMAEKTHEFFIQGYRIEEIFYCCPSCGIDYGNRDHVRPIAKPKYCSKCGQALKWPKETKR